MHHEFDHPIAFSAYYVHMFEFIISFIIPSKIGVFVIGPDLHVVSILMYGAFGSTRVIYYHCGYDFPYIPMTTPFFGRWLIS